MVYNGAISAILCIKQSLVRSAREEMKELPIINNWQKLLNYLKVSIVSINVDQTPLYIREVIKRALVIGSTSIVISHNHPSGDLQPSSSDIMLTRQLAEACHSIGIELVDHVIVTFNNHFSFKENKLL